MKPKKKTVKLYTRYICTKCSAAFVNIIFSVVVFKIKKKKK